MTLLVTLAVATMIDRAEVQMWILNGLMDYCDPAVEIDDSAWSRLWSRVQTMATQNLHHSSTVWTAKRIGKNDVKRLAEGFCLTSATRQETSE